MKNELEDFFEDIDAGVRQNFVFHLKHNILERFLFGRQLVVSNQIVDGEAFADNVRERLR